MREGHVGGLTGFVSFVAVALVFGACEQPPPKKSEPSATARPTALAPPPTATATEAKTAEKPARPRKKVEDCPSGTKVSFESPAFEEEVRRKLPKPTGDITKADLARLKSLNVSSLKFPDLDPCVFTHMTGLKELFLGPGEYDDLSPLKNSTKLESLRASISQVRDISALSEMTKLDRLDLGRTQVADLKPLAGLKLISELQLDDTPVEDLGPLAKLEKLERLSIQRTRVKDASALKGLKNLKFLYVAGSPVEEDQTSLGPVRANGAKVMTQ
jgi:internalin A